MNKIAKIKKLDNKEYWKYEVTYDNLMYLIRYDEQWEMELYDMDSNDKEPVEDYGFETLDEAFEEIFG